MDACGFRDSRFQCQTNISTGRMCAATMRRLHSSSECSALGSREVLTTKLITMRNCSGYKIKWVLFCIILAAIASGTEAFNNVRISIYNETHEEFINRLLTGYNRHLRPGLESEEKVIVSVGIQLTSLAGVSARDMQYTLGMVLYQWWTDERFNYANVYNDSLILSYYYHKIWTPDTFFRNAKRASLHSVTHDNRYIHVTPNGLVTLAEKITATMSCHMDLYYFPHDTQHCKIYISSFGYPTKDFHLKWHSYGVQFDQDLKLPEFLVKRIDTSRCIHDTITGNFTCIEAMMTLHRDTGFYMIQTYIPTVVFVMLSWLNFFMDPKAVPARVALGLLTVVAITTKSSSALTQLPKVSYVKAIDVWMSTSLGFVLLAFAEYCLVHYVQNFCEIKEDSPDRRRIPEPEPNGAIQIHPVTETVSGGQDKSTGSSTQETSFSNAKYNNDWAKPRDSENNTRPEGSTSWASPSRHRYTVTESDEKERTCGCLAMRKKRPVHAAIDYWSRWLFPLTFIIFNLFYWIKYTKGL